MRKHRENIKKYGVGGVVVFVLLSVLFAAPVQAQGPFQTPTPLPGVVATQQAADATANAVQAARNDAAALEARAAEIRRNADAQAQQAAQAIADARAASAAQNAAAIGEAIGRADSNLSQLQESVQGQAAIISTLQTAGQDKDAQIDQLKAQLSDTANRLSNAAAQLQQVKADNTRLAGEKKILQTQIDEQPKTDMPRFAAMLLAFVVVIGLFIAWGWHVIQNRKPAPPADPQIIDAAPIDRDSAVDGEYHED